MTRTADLPPSSSLAWDPLDSPWRWPLAAATGVAAAAHVPVIAPHLHEAPYMGEEFIVLTAACLLLGIAAVVCDSAAVYGLTALTCGLAIAGYVATRLIAFPHLGDDVGNWFETLGMVSVLAEAAAVVASIAAIGAGRRRQRRIARGPSWANGFAAVDRQRVAGTARCPTPVPTGAGGAGQSLPGSRRAA